MESEVLEPNQEDVINADNLAQAKNDDLFAIDTTGSLQLSFFLLLESFRRYCVVFAINAPAIVEL